MANLVWEMVSQVRSAYVLIKDLPYPSFESDTLTLRRPHSFEGANGKASQMKSLLMFVFVLFRYSDAGADPDTIQFLNHHLKFIKMAQTSPTEMKGLFEYQGKGSIEDKFILLAAGVNPTPPRDFKDYVDQFVSQEKTRHITEKIIPITKLLTPNVKANSAIAYVEHTMGSKSDYLYCIEKFENKKTQILSLDFCMGVLQSGPGDPIILKLIAEGQKSQPEIIKELENYKFPIHVVNVDDKGKMTQGFPSSEQTSSVAPTVPLQRPKTPVLWGKDVDVTSSVINGIKVPHSLPGPDISDLKGTDSDHNGVRDEVDRALANSYGKYKPMYQGAMKLARFYQTWFDHESLSDEQLKKLVIEESRILWCLQQIPPDPKGDPRVTGLVAAKEVNFRTFSSTLRMNFRRRLFAPLKPFPVPTGGPCNDF